MGHLNPGTHQLLSEAIEALVGVGELKLAREYLERLTKRGRALDSPWALATSARCRGILASVEGDPEGALDAFADALDEHERLPQPFERARTLLALGMTQRRAKQRRAARQSLQHAFTIFEELGAAVWSDRARAELGRIGGRRTATTLTSSEERVAALVAQGRTNREVAEELYITERTVEGHLSHIYGKLGIRSRTELARRFVAPPSVEG